MGNDSTTANRIAGIAQAAGGVVALNGIDNVWTGLQQVTAYFYLTTEYTEHTEISKLIRS
ncbi:MAG: hypothetical protein LBU34_08315 [Planctomycetaceae bacterium]|nr:hypothetical protein [Planctomycetaceae bacterium]